MKWILAGFLMTASPGWASALVTDLIDPDRDERAATVIVLGDGASGITCADVESTSAAGDAKPCLYVVKEAKGHNDGRSEHRVVRLVKEDDTNVKAQGWLGVSIGEVPETLAAQLDLDGRGTVILNVVTDGPADRAGLKAHDVIISLAGEAADGDVGRLAKLVGAHQAGEAVDVVVLRKGAEKSFAVQLGSRADAKGFEWKFEAAPLAELKEKFHTRGRMLKRGPEGDWELKDLGDLKELADLPENIKMLIPKTGSRTVNVWADDGKQKLTLIVERDGKVLEIKQEDGGDIRVQRTGEGGIETTAVYHNEDELREADEEAYEAFQNAGKTIVLELDLDDVDISNIKLDVDPEEWEENVFEWRTELEEGLGKAREGYEQAMEQLRETLEQLKTGEHQVILEDLEGLEDLPEILKGLHKPNLFGHAGKPRHSFELQEDGTIKVRIRKGDSELVQRYSDEDDLARRNPELYDKYRDLMSVEEQ